MAFEEFVATYFWYIFGIVFLVGTVLLYRTKFERAFIIFLIRTKHGIRLLERLGRISPSLWTFLGDMAVIVSFGGVGTLYVSKYRSVTTILGILAVLSVIFFIPLAGPVVATLALAFMLVALMIISKVDNKPFQRKLLFVLTSLIIFIIVLGFAGSLRPGATSVVIALLTGIFGLPGLLIGSLASQAVSIVTQESSLPGISPLLPGISSAGEVGFIFPGFDIFIPLWSGLLALIILLVSHEFCHGILARVQGIKVKSMGLLTFGIIPIGAFVEPDEKQLEKKKSQEKMRVYAMGSFANLIVAALAAILFLGLSVGIAGMVNPQGVEIVGVNEGFPAEVLEPGSIIHRVNGVQVTSLEAYLVESALLSPGDDITLDTDQGIFTLTSIENPNDSTRAYLGFTLRTSLDLKSELSHLAIWFQFLLAVASALEIIFFLNFNIAIVNLLPIAPFDGSKMFEEVLKSFKIKPGRRKKIISAVVWIVIILLLVNALPLGNVVLGYLGV